MTPAEAAPARHRVFFALWPDAAAAASLSSLATRLAASGGRIMRAPSLHLTLAFIGGVSAQDIAALTAAAGRVAGSGFEVRLDRLCHWPRGGILHALPSEVPAAMRQLTGDLADELAAAGFPAAGRGDRGQNPHVTLLRNAPAPRQPELIEAVAWPAKGFVLVENQPSATGSDYRVLARFPLAGGGMR